MAKWWVAVAVALAGCVSNQLAGTLGTLAIGDLPIRADVTQRHASGEDCKFAPDHPTIAAAMKNATRAAPGNAMQNVQVTLRSTLYGIVVLNCYVVEGDVVAIQEDAALADARSRRAAVEVEYGELRRSLPKDGILSKILDACEAENRGTEAALEHTLGCYREKFDLLRKSLPLSEENHPL